MSDVLTVTIPGTPQNAIVISVPEQLVTPGSVNEVFVVSLTGPPGPSGNVDFPTLIDLGGPNDSLGV